ncbi:hypothetical protein [Klenkia terrae]|uniref:Uncharacterized protein n=1 Tax=Klenkia terrae TaxID=1052259 RepID=A0ABU8E3T0_9ACTN|nr:hypothetical protein [Klenkia terrae]
MVWVFAWMALAVSLAVIVSAAIHLAERRRHVEQPKPDHDREPPAAAVL